MVAVDPDHRMCGLSCMLFATASSTGAPGRKGTRAAWMSSDRMASLGRCNAPIALRRSENSCLMRWIVACRSRRPCACLPSVRRASPAANAGGGSAAASRRSRGRDRRVAGPRRGKGGWRRGRVNAPRPRRDFAQCIREVGDVHSPEAARLVLVLDQRNTHSPEPLYAAFSPAAAKRLADKLESHDTPKHGRWRTMAESALSVLQRQCLDRRLGNRVARERRPAAATTNAAREPIQQCRCSAKDMQVKARRDGRGAGGLWRPWGDPGGGRSGPCGGRPATIGAPRQ